MEEKVLMDEESHFDLMDLLELRPNDQKLVDRKLVLM
jgi:hypothetical protein